MSAQEVGGREYRHRWWVGGSIGTGGGWEGVSAPVVGGREYRQRRWVGGSISTGGGWEGVSAQEVGGREYRHRATQTTACHSDSPVACSRKVDVSAKNKPKRVL